MIFFAARIKKNNNCRIRFVHQTTLCTQYDRWPLDAVGILPTPAFNEPSHISTFQTQSTKGEYPVLSWQVSSLIGHPVSCCSAPSEPRGATNASLVHDSKQGCTLASQRCSSLCFGVSSQPSRKNKRKTQLLLPLAFSSSSSAGKMSVSCSLKQMASKPVTWQQLVLMKTFHWSSTWASKWKRKGVFTWLWKWSFVPDQ